MLHEFGDNQKLDISVNGKERWIRINCCSCLNEGVLLSFIFVVIVGVGVQKCERWEVLELKIDLTSYSCLQVDIQIIEILRYWTILHRFFKLIIQYQKWPNLSLLFYVPDTSLYLVKNAFTPRLINKESNF